MSAHKLSKTYAIAHLGITYEYVDILISNPLYTYAVNFPPKWWRNVKGPNSYPPMKVHLYTHHPVTMHIHIQSMVYIDSLQSYVRSTIIHKYYDCCARSKVQYYNDVTKKTQKS